MNFGEEGIEAGRHLAKYKRAPEIMASRLLKSCMSLLVHRTRWRVRNSEVHRAWGTVIVYDERFSSKTPCFQT